MPDLIARKRLKKKMLDRWENEGGRVGTDTTTADGTRATGENKGVEKKCLLRVITRRSGKLYLRRSGASLPVNESRS